jgi:multidrug efflux pump subunit AcrB
VVAALLLLLITPFVLMRTPTDVLPNINIPVVSIIWNYTGLSARDIEQRMVYTEERVLTTTVNNIEHMESNSYDGFGIIKIFFQPGVTISQAVAQVTAVSQTILRQLPPGTTPPLILQYSASSVPVLQYGVGGEGLNEQQALDIAMNQLRVGLVTVPGVGIPYPFGGKQRTIEVDLDMRKLQEKNLSQIDVSNAFSTQALVFPSGTVKLGEKQFQVDINTFPLKVDSLNQLPIKTVNGALIRIGDVAQVRDGSEPQTNIVRLDGVRSVLMSILKTGDASTLAVVSGVKEKMAQLLQTVSDKVRVKPFADQSIFVTAAVNHSAQPTFQFYHSLCAVKVLLATLRSTLTVLASRMGGPYRSRSKSSC